MFEELKEEMSAFYDTMRVKSETVSETGSGYLKAMELGREISEDMDLYFSEHPGISSALLKSRLHTLIAAKFRPVIFPDSPFYFEMGLRHACSWGMDDHSPASWQHHTFYKRSRSVLSDYLDKRMKRAYIQSKNSLGLCSIPAFFDIDHHTLGYTKLFECGLEGIRSEIKDSLKQYKEGSDEAWYLQAMEESLTALETISGKFADEALRMLPSAKTDSQRHCLMLIAQTAGRVPANPPRTFYEGLAMILFLREVTGTIEDIGISSLSHADRLLGDLYEADIREGRLTREEAKELLGSWMLFTDIKFDLAHNSWPETSTCVTLGGSDKNGRPIFNEVTRLFIEAHSELKLVNPKLNCRMFKDSPTEYLTLIASALQGGDNNFALINDDVIVPALIKSGVARDDAFHFVNGGCQETMIEGCGHTEGAFLYLCLPRFLQLYMRAESGSEEFISPMKTVPETFEAFYREFMMAFDAGLSLLLEHKRVRFDVSRDRYICPAFSLSQEGCISSGKDYSHGGAKYNFSTICLTGIATLTDSLMVIRELVYGKKLISMDELLPALGKNWDGFPELRRKILDMPKYGTGHAKPDALAARITGDLNRLISEKRNSRGGRYLMSMFVYYYYKYFADYLKATPDGRCDYDLISTGVAPSQLAVVKDPTAPVLSVKSVDYTMLGGGNAVLDVQLPLSADLTDEKIAAYALWCARSNCPTLQPNAVRPEDLIAAKSEPEKYKNLIVRICGLSAYFVALTPEVQDEIIARTLYRI